MSEDSTTYTMVASAVNHPDRVHRLWGLFNHRSLDAMVRTGVDVRAVVPRPHAPPVGPYSQYRSIPSDDESFVYPVAHPRFLYYLPKSLLYHRTGDSFASTLRSWYENTGCSADVFHGCHLYPDGYGLSELAQSKDIPLTAYAHGTIVNEFAEFNTGTRRRIEATIEVADRIFCSGNAIQSKVHEIDSRANTAVVPIGATPAHFPTDRQEALRQELKVPPDATVVLYCGHLTEAKGVEDLIDVLPDIDGEKLYLVFIGHGGELKAAVADALSDERTPPGKLLWELDPVAVRRWFAVANILVLPSYSEGRPTVIYEAMASQTPVLATDVGGIPEQIDDGKTGWIIDPGDRTALRETLQNLPVQELQRMGTAAERRLVEKGWTWEGHATAISTAHRELLEQH